MKNAYRKELKYIISIREFNKLRRKIAAYMKPDKNLVNGYYVVRSLYFDTIGNSDLFGSLHGHMQKSKIRLRMYPPNMEDIKLEMKEKSGSDGRKIWVNVSKDEVNDLMHCRYNFLLQRETQAAQKIYNKLVTNAYMPKTIVEYKRTAYYLPVSDTRVTFDYDVGISETFRTFFKERIITTPVAQRNYGVLEVKYNDMLLGVIKNILKDMDCLNEANSKYVQSRLLF